MGIDWTLEFSANEEIGVRALTILCLVFLTGCASQIMESYVGQPVTEAMLDYGAPSNVMTLEDGRRAYQWTINKSRTVAVPTTSTTTVRGPSGTASVHGRSMTHVPRSQTCVYTLTSAQRGGQWIVDGFRKPRSACK